MSAHLFVYGTLRSRVNNPMARWLAERARLMGPATIQARLYSFGQYPGAVLSDDPEDVVRGEIYYVVEPAALFARLDPYEGNGFRRLQVEARAGDATIVSWVYVSRGRPGEENHIESGDFLPPID